MALIITVNVSDDDEACLLNDLLGIDDWVQKAVKGKIEKCRERMIREWQPKLFADPAVTQMPADTDAFIAMVLARPDYSNRAARESK